MKKIITAMGNNKLLDEISKTGVFDVLTRDIPYKEGILEMLEQNPQIDILIVNEILDGEISFRDLIRKILQINEKIEIIVFVEEKNTEIQNFLFSNGIYKIYQNNEIDFKTFLNILSNNNENLSPNLDYINREMLEIRKKIEEQNNLNQINLEARGKIIALFGAYNSGKSILTCLWGKEHAKKGRRTLIIDFDIYNKSIRALFNINKNNNDIANIEKQIIHISKNLDVICVMDLLFNDNNSVDFINLEEMMQNFQIMYDVILVDTSSDYKYKYLSRILNVADSVVFLIVPTMIEIKKSFDLFEILLEDFNIDIKKIQIVLNKVNNYSVDNLLISKTFQNIKITGNSKYDEQIEKNFIDKKIVKR